MTQVHSWWLHRRLRRLRFLFIKYNQTSAGLFQISSLLRNSRHCICMQRLLLGLALALVALAANAASAPPDAFDPATANLDKDQLAQSIRSNTKATVRASQTAASCQLPLLL
jgi:hypothetical protein